MDEAEELGVDRGPDRADVGARLDFARLRGAVLGRDRRARPGPPCPRPARRSPGRGLSGSPRRRSGTPASARPGTARSAPAGAGSPTGRCAGCPVRRPDGETRGTSTCFPPRLPRWLPRRGPNQMVQPLQRQSEVRPALGLGDRVDLVDDHRFDAGEDLADGRGHHQVEGLRRGDQDVGRRLRHRPTVFLRRVAGPQADRDVGADAAQRGAQVALDVVGERFQRRDVDDADAGAELRRAGEAVDPPEEAGQGLAGAGGGADQRVLAAGDRRPAARLGRRRPGEGGLEPAPYRRRERRQRVRFGGSFRFGRQPIDLTRLLCPTPGAAGCCRVREVDPAFAPSSTARRSGVSSTGCRRRT